MSCCLRMAELLLRFALTPEPPAALASAAHPVELTQKHSEQIAQIVGRNRRPAVLPFTFPHSSPRERQSKWRHGTRPWQCHGRRRDEGCNGNVKKLQGECGRFPTQFASNFGFFG